MALCGTGAAAQPGAGASPLAEATIIVTGSRIRRDAIDASEPLTLITAPELAAAGLNSAAEALQGNRVVQGASQVNNYYGGLVTNGGIGASTLSLRGLGPTRTLVLLNGYRVAPAGTRGSIGSTDLNVLPRALIDHVELFKAGASSIYGSDAIAGVVNIVTDRALAGLVVDGQVTVPEIGAGVDRRLSASFGHRGNNFRLLGSVEWFRSDSIARNDVAWASCPIAGYLTGPGTAFGSGDHKDPATGKPACFTLDNGGVTINALGVPNRVAVSATTGANGTFNRLRPNASITTGNTPGYVGVDRYSRDTFDARNEEEELVTPIETWTGFLQAGYDIGALGDAEAYVEILANRRKSSTTLYRQLSIDYARGSPLLPAIFRNGQFAAPNEISNGKIIAARAFVSFGDTPTAQQVDFVRVAGGLRGDFVLPGWRYDLHAGKSWSDGDYSQVTFLTDRLARSLNALDNGNGTFRCADSSDARCVAAPPVNAATIGGDLPQAFRDYILADVKGTTRYRESTLSFSADGAFFSLLGGAAKAALGGEYRDASIDDMPPIDSINANLYNLTAAAPTRGSDRVWELFGELSLPILADLPFAYRLNLAGSARYTHYDSYGGQKTYAIQAGWEPMRGIALRAGYGTSYRAPALFEQFLGATTSFEPPTIDPCDDYASKPSATLKANCAAVGLPGNFEQLSSIVVSNTGGANAGLSAETSRNFSAGLLVAPALPGAFGEVSLRLDYFAIQVDNGVAQVGPAAILDLCYKDATFDPGAGYCRLVTRDANFELKVANSYINITTDKVRGLEFDLRHARDIGPGRLALGALVTHYLERANRLFPTDPLESTNGIIGSPDWTGTFDATYRIGPVQLRWGMDWIGGDHARTYESIVRAADGSIDPANLALIKGRYYYEVDDYFLHSASVQVAIDRFQLTAGVKNLFDTAPPRISVDEFGFRNMTANAPIYSGYDFYGRRFFLNTTARF